MTTSTILYYQDCRLSSWFSVSGPLFVKGDIFFMVTIRGFFLHLFVTTFIVVRDLPPN